MPTYTVSQAAERTGWSPRMLRYLESTGLVVPERSAAGYRRYGEHELDLLRGARGARRRFGVELDDVAFVVRLRREPELRAAVDRWLAGTDGPRRGGERGRLDRLGAAKARAAARRLTRQRERNAWQRPSSTTSRISRSRRKACGGSSGPTGRCRCSPRSASASSASSRSPATACPPASTSRPRPRT